MMGDWVVTLGIVAFSGVVLAVEKAITEMVNKSNPPKEMEGDYKKQKQAFLLIDNGHDHEWGLIFTLSPLSAICTGTFAAIGSQSLTAVMQFALISGSIMIPMYAGLVDILSFRVMRRIKKIGKALEEKGYDISIIHKFNGNIDALVEQIKRTADADTVTVLFYHGHGYAMSREDKRTDCYDEKFLPDIARRKTISILARGKIPDVEVVHKLSEIPGDKVVLINACQAGGFAYAATNLPEDRKEKFALITSSDGRDADKLNKLAPSFRGYVEDNGGQSVSEFFRKHADEHSSRKSKRMTRYSPVLYAPQAAVGKRQIRL